MRRRIDVRNRQSASFKSAIEAVESQIDAALDAVDENMELPIYVDIHDHASKHPLLAEIVAEKYRSEGGFDCLVVFGGANEDRTEIEIG
jgi:hypothetical protein